MARTPKNDWFPLVADVKRLQPMYAIDNHEDHLTLLGKLLARWAHLERLLCKALAHLLDENYDAALAIYYAPNNLGVRIDILRATIKQVMPEGKPHDGMLHILERIERLSRARNKYVHSMPFSEDGAKTPYLLDIRTTREKVVDFNQYPISNLEDHIRLVEEVSSRLVLAMVEESRFCRPPPAFLLVEYVRFGYIPRP